MYIILPHWNGTNNWNTSSHKMKTFASCVNNTMVADGLVMQEARASAAMTIA